MCALVSCQVIAPFNDLLINPGIVATKYTVEIVVLTMF